MDWGIFYSIWPGGMSPRYLPQAMLCEEPRESRSDRVLLQKLLLCSECGTSPTGTCWNTWSQAGGDVLGSSGSFRGWGQG